MSAPALADESTAVQGTISGFALRAQLPSSQPTTTNTANGVTNACLAKVPELSFGNFRMTNVDVMILPGVVGAKRYWT